MQLEQDVVAAAERHARRKTAQRDALQVPQPRQGPLLAAKVDRVDV
jgi:hypothetical protein